MRPLYVIWLLLGPSIFAMAQDEATPDQWKEDAADAKLTPKQIAHLEKEKVLMTTDSVLQCYQAYLSPHKFGRTRDTSKLPWFITTDALFHAYTVSLQKGLSGMERAHSDQLRDFLAAMLQKLEKPLKPAVEGDAALITEATLRAKLLIGVSARLIEVKDHITPTELEREVEAEAARIRAAQGSGMIQRLGMNQSTSELLDYTQFRPAGFYAADLALSRYF